MTAHRRGLSTTAVNNVTSGAATTTTAGDLIVGGVEDNTNQITITAGTGFTQRNSLDNTDSAIQDKVQTAAGSIASTQTFSEANNSYSAVMVCAKTRRLGGNGCYAAVRSNGGDKQSDRSIDYQSSIYVRQRRQ